MKNSQPIFDTETLSHENTSPNVLLPRLSLPQVTPAQVIANRQHAHAINTLLQQQASPATPLPQIPITPPLIEPFTRQALVLQTKQDASSLVSELQVPFPIARFDFSRSLRSGVTYIPRSMIRHEEPTIADALIACGTLITIGLFLLILLYCLSL